MVTTYSTYCLGSVASLNFFAIENMPHHFKAHVCYGQVAGWIRMPLGLEVGLGPGDIVLDGDPAPPPCKGAQQPSTFRPTALACIPTGLHFTHNPQCTAGGSRGIPMDNCHPSSFIFVDKVLLPYTDTKKLSVNKNPFPG